MLTSLLPWPGRRQRKAAIAEAVRERDVSRQKAGQARKVSQSISDLAYNDNHWAQMVAESLGITHKKRG